MLIYLRRSIYLSLSLSLSIYIYIYMQLVPSRHSVGDVMVFCLDHLQYAGALARRLCASLGEKVLCTTTATTTTTTNNNDINRSNTINSNDG